MNRTQMRSVTLLAMIFVLFLSGGLLAGQKGGPAWYSVTSIKRVQKPNRHATRPLPKQQKAPLLTIQWHLLKRIDDDNVEQTDPTATFQTGDMIKVGITANQAGYLYIVNQPEGKDAIVLFPDPRINKGQNYVAKDTEYVVPGYCPDFEDPKDCWFKMTPPAGRETLLVIFSRLKITSLPNVALKPFAAVARSDVEALIASSAQKVEQFTGDLTTPKGEKVRFATRVQNTNPQDNEELIATIELNHGD
jgi:hypothetical protein